MATAQHHPLLETRLAVLAARIAALNERLNTAEGVERADERLALQELESRQTKLAERLHEIERAAPEARQSAGDELEVMADDLSTAIADLIRGIEDPIAASPAPRIE